MWILNVFAHQILYQAATNFLQGLYPPLGELNSSLAIEELANGTSTGAPLDGYQFILIHGEGETDPDTIWIKGDDNCPAYSRASKSYRESTEYQTTLSQTAEFYSKFTPLLGPIMGEENISYSQAFDVYDLLNVASIHNASVASEIDADDLNRLRYLADEWEWNRNFNASQPDRSIGGRTLAGGFLRQLKSVVESNAKTKFSLMAGSYDTFLSFFGLTDLTAADQDFHGIPKFASSMALELHTDGDETAFPAKPEQDLKVRFLFRNGTGDDDVLNPYPLFGASEESIPYGRFVDELGRRSILTLSDWCTTCQSEAEFCAAASNNDFPAARSCGKADPALPTAAAGGIGAAVAVAVVSLVVALAWLIIHMRRRRNAIISPQRPLAEKRLSDSASDSV